MKHLTIDNKTARRIILNGYLLDEMTVLSDGKKGVLEVLDRLGYIQIDSIQAVKKAQHHTLWTRLPDYLEEMLLEMQHTDRTVFEYWGHALSYLPMKDYRFFMSHMRDMSEMKTKWGIQRMKIGGHLLEPVLAGIRKNGAMAAKDFLPKEGEIPGIPKNTPAQAVRVALDLLFWRGDVMVTERKKMNRIFDLTERVVPEGIDRSHPSNEETAAYFISLGLTAMGLAREKELLAFMQPDALRDSDLRSASVDVVSSALDRFKQEKKIVEVLVESDNHNNGKNSSSDVYYAWPDRIENIGTLGEMPEQVHILSPFDNFTINRDRMKRLFGFDYSLECYMPPKKRTYGYFVLPVLWGDRLVARMDSNADVKKKTFVILNLVFEPDFQDFDAFLPLFSEKLKAFATFNGCKSFKIEKVSPANIKAVLKKLL